MLCGARKSARKEEKRETRRKSNGGHGPHFAPKGVLELTPAPRARLWFRLQLARVSGVLTVSLNGTKAFTVPMAFPCEGFALRPWRSPLICS